MERNLRVEVDTFCKNKVHYLAKYNRLDFIQEGEIKGIFISNILCTDQTKFSSIKIMFKKTECIKHLE